MRLPADRSTMATQERSDAELEADIFETVVVNEGDAARITIPKEAAEEWDLEPGDTLVIEGAKGDTELRVSPASAVQVRSR